MRRAAAAKPFRPPDAAELERILDWLAGLMDRSPRERHLMLPIWSVFEEKLTEARAAEAIFEAARQRVIRSRDRTEAQAS